ncbi:hypothetical protein Ac2012v2_008121 [Leucoagaricus gongylophorus]
MKRGAQHLKLTQSGCTLIQGSDLRIELASSSTIYGNIWFMQIEAKSKFKVEFDNLIQGLQLWLVIEDHSLDLNTLDPQIKNAMVELNKFRSVLSRLGSTRDAVGMFMELGKAISGLNSAANGVFSCIDVVYKHLKGQDEAHSAITRLAQSIEALANQLKGLEEVPTSDILCHTIGEFPALMEEVVIFIQKWLKSWMFKHVFVDSQKEGAIELQAKLKNTFDTDLNIEMRIAQAKAKAADEKKLDDLLHSAAKPSLRNPCVAGTRSDILARIESELKRVDGSNVIWIRGSPGVGKSALAASIAIRLQEQNRQVICFRFDRTESSTITTDALWRVVARDLTHLYHSPLSTLNGVSREELPVIVIDALDECGGLRHDSSGQRDYESLLRTLKHWVEVDDLNKSKLVITSRPEDRIAQTFPDLISTHCFLLSHH